jgi:ribonucleoside-diphosphate reductase beta chain
MIKFVRKRNDSTEQFNSEKIKRAVNSAMRSTNIRSRGLAEEIADNVMTKLTDSVDGDTVHVDQVHKLVENTIMDMGLHDLAREYITFRVNNMPDIFRKRINLKPYEYTQLLEYKEAIRHSYWIHTEFNYTSDVQDMKVSLSPPEAETVKRAMLAIAQIEVQVKKFWGKVGDVMPKPEIQAVGATFAESEVRHADAYSHLLEIMGLNDDFKDLMNVPAIKKRMEYLEQSIQTPVDNKDYFHKVILFSMFVENVSLFSQFLIMMAFNKHKNVLKGISNAVEATSKEEDIHARFGFDLVNTIKEENPDWWNKETIATIKRQCREAMKAEAGIIDWIYDNNDLAFLPKHVVIEFTKDRFNQSLNAIGIDSIYEVDKDAIKSTDWFMDEIIGTKNVDFFVKRSTSYSKKTKSFTEDDLF